MYIRVHERDNVGIIVSPEGATMREHIPQAHKAALSEIQTGEPIVRYGQPIGYASRPIPAGAWVREEFIDLPAAPPLDTLPLATAVPPPLPALQYHRSATAGSDGN